MSAVLESQSSTNQHVIQSTPTSTSIPFPPSGPSTPALTTNQAQASRPGSSSAGPSQPQPNGQLPSTAAQHALSQSQFQPQTQPLRAMSAYDRESAGRKRKWSALGFNEAEQDSMERTTTAFHYALAQDQLATLFPEAPTRFSSYEDVVQRLVPYHIWQTCDEELEGYEGGNPRKRIAQQAREEAQAADTLTRMTKINARFMRIRTSDAQKPSGTIDLIQLIKESTSALREELSTVQAQLRVATADRHVVEWHERNRQQEQRRLDQERRDAETRRHNAIMAASAEAQAQANLRARAEAQAKAQVQAMDKEKDKESIVASSPSKSMGPIAPKTQSTKQATASSSSVDTPSRSAQAPAQATSTPTPTRGRGRPKGSGLRAQAIAQAGTVPNTPATSSKTKPSQHTPSTTSHTNESQSHNVATESGLAEEPSEIVAIPPTSARTIPAQSTPSSSTSPAPVNKSTPKGSQRTTRASASNGLPAAGPMKGPVSITVPIASVPDLLRAEVLSRDPDGPTRPPATIARKADDKKGVVLSIDLSKCNPKQLVALARVLKVDTTANGSGGTRDAVAKVADGNGSG